MNTLNPLNISTFNAGFKAVRFNDEALYHEYKQIRKIVDNSFNKVAKDILNQETLRKNYIIKELEMCGYTLKISKNMEVYRRKTNDGLSLRICDIEFVA